MSLAVWEVFASRAVGGLGLKIIIRFGQLDDSV